MINHNNNRSSTDDDDDGNALFVKNGAPVKFCFHRSVTQGRGQITRDVERHGGKVVQDERRANVLLVDEQEDITFIRRRYYSSTELYRLSLYVEPRGFVQTCIRSSSYYHVRPPKQGMSGRVQGGAVKKRTQFTEEDRNHLAYYLATRLPTRDGRMGNSAYKDLERLGQTNDQSWAWARRHTFHSWREHYKIHRAIMDARIDHYLAQLKDVGHHFGHDMRSHNYLDLREEDEEDEEGEEDEEQWQGIERQESERRERVRPAVAAAARAREYRARRGQDLVTSDDDEGDGAQEEETAIWELQRIKRQRIHARQQRDVQKTRAKRARVSETPLDERRASDAETRRGENNPARERESIDEESPEVEGSDLFGDRAYGDESPFEFDHSQEIDPPVPFSPRRSSPVLGQEGLSTQATLVASPLTAQKEHALMPSPIPRRKVVEPEGEAPAPKLAPKAAVPPSSQTSVVNRARVRGASAQPGPSAPKVTRTRGDAAGLVAPFRNTGARPRSVDPQPEPQPISQSARPREDRPGKGKGRAREETLVTVEEDVPVEEEPKALHVKKEDTESDAVSGRLSMRETFEDEMAVEVLLETGTRSGVDEDARSKADDEDGDDEESGGDIMAALPRYQELEVGGEPTDSDDASTHDALVRGAVGEGKDAERDQGSQDRDQPGQDGDSDADGDADADRVEQMASRSLHVAPVPMPLWPRITRSQTRAQTQAYPQTSPRRTRSVHKEARPPPKEGAAAQAVRGRKKRG